MNNAYQVNLNKIDRERIEELKSLLQTPYERETMKTISAAEVIRRAVFEIWKLKNNGTK